MAAFDTDGDGSPGDYLLPDGQIDPAKFSAQGHRGSRDLGPENTLPAFEAGLDNLMNTMETDTGITRDGVPVLSHDPFLDPTKCRNADGTPPAQDVLIRDLTARADPARLRLRPAADRPASAGTSAPGARTTTS